MPDRYPVGSAFAEAGKNLNLAPELQSRIVK